MLRTHLIAKLALPLALFLAACPGKTKPTDPSKPKSASTSLTPGATDKGDSIVLGGGSGGSASGGGGAATGGGTAAPAREVDKSSVKKFKKALEDYADAKKSGKLAEKCKKISENFEESFKEDADLIEGLFNAGAVLMECGKTSEAEGYFDRVLAKKPGYPRALSSKGYLRYKEGKVSEAKKLFEEAVTSSDLEGQVEARINLASILIEQYFQQDPAKRDGTLIGNDGAQGHLRRALAVDSQNVQAYGALAMLYYRTGRYGLAGTICRRAIAEVSADYAPMYHILGLVALQQKKVTQALKFFNDGLAKDANYAPSLMNVGAITIRFRDYTTAKEKFERVISLDPKNFEAQISLGVAYRGLNDYENAEKAYLKARDLNPSHPSSYFNLGTLYQDYNLTKAPYNNPKELYKKYEEAKRYYTEFKSKAGASKEWESYIKDADKRMKQCDDLIRVTKATASATP